MTDRPSVVELLAEVMGEVQAIGKQDRNAAQGFNFRGIDSVINAVGPALRKHGVVVVPDVRSFTSHQYETRNGATMRNVTVEVAYRFHGPAGDSIECAALGEAADAGDKAVPKAMSVAYRVALLQALCIPTHDPDPDSSSHERAGLAHQDSEPVDLHGWPTADAHNEVKASIGEKAKQLPADLQAEVKQWLRDQPWSFPATPEQMETYRREVDRQHTIARLDDGKGAE